MSEWSGLAVIVYWEVLNFWCICVCVAVRTAVLRGWQQRRRHHGRQQSHWEVSSSQRASLYWRFVHFTAMSMFFFYLFVSVCILYLTSLYITLLYWSRLYAAVTNFVENPRLFVAPICNVQHFCLSNIYTGRTSCNVYLSLVRLAVFRFKPSVSVWSDVRVVSKVRKGTHQCCHLGLKVRGQGLVNWSSRILTDKDFPRGQQHWVTVKTGLYQ